MTSVTVLDATRRGRTAEPEFSLADRLRKIRFDVLGMRQREFAEDLGVTRSAYAAWEAGRTKPRDVVALAQRIESKFGVTAAWTLGTNPHVASEGDAEPVPSHADESHDSDIPAWTLGWRLQRALAHAGLRADEIAAELGVTRTTISRWVNDRGAPPKTAYVRQWALRTGVPYSWLRDGDNGVSTDGTHPARKYMDSHIPDNSSYITGAGHLGVCEPAAVACGAAA